MNESWASNIHLENCLESYGNSLQLLKASCVSGQYVCILEVVADKHNHGKNKDYHLNVRFHSRYLTDGTRIPRQNFQVPIEVQKFQHSSIDKFSQLKIALFSNHKKTPKVAEENSK